MRGVGSIAVRRRVRLSPYNCRNSQIVSSAVVVFGVDRCLERSWFPALRSVGRLFLRFVPVGHSNYCAVVNEPEDDFVFRSSTFRLPLLLEIKIQLEQQKDRQKSPHTLAIQILLVLPPLDVLLENTSTNSIGDSIRTTQWTWTRKIFRMLVHRTDSYSTSRLSLVVSRSGLGITRTAMILASSIHRTFIDWKMRIVLVQLIV